MQDFKNVQPCLNSSQTKVLQVINRHKAIKQSIGVGAGKFWGCEGFLPEFAQTCPKYFCATFAYKFSPSHKDHEDLFLV